MSPPHATELFYLIITVVDITLLYSCFTPGVTVVDITAHIFIGFTCGFYIKYHLLILYSCFIM